MKHLRLQIAVHLLERKLRERTKLTAPGLDGTFWNNFDCIGIGAVISDRGDVAAVPGLANAVVEQSGRQRLGGRFQRKGVAVSAAILPELLQSINKWLHLFSSKAVLAQ